MKIVKRSMGWLPRPSMYHQTMSNRAKWKSAHQTYLSNNANLATAISEINVNMVIESGNIASRVAKSRLFSKYA